MSTVLDFRAYHRFNSYRIPKVLRSQPEMYKPTGFSCWCLARALWACCRLRLTAARQRALFAICETSYSYEEQKLKVLRIYALKQR